MGGRGHPARAQAADAAVKLFNEDIIPLRQTREDLRYTQVQIARMEQMDAAAAAVDPLTRAAEAFRIPPPAPEQPEPALNGAG